jgi:hypothetical protein
MSYITREDGEHFVIPSYRDTLAAKNKKTLKKEILGLSEQYGEYITLQRKGQLQYEIAFSPDTGYLLGETVWHHFKRPLDMIYCEVIPDTTEAILVIVKAGSVYLDGSFPIDNIAEELIIFLTQKNNFEIYVYGDVPISQVPEEGKLAFAAESVRSFTELEQPIFPELPLLKIYKLELVEPVLRMHGIGVFPLRQWLTVLLMAGAAIMLWSHFSQQEEVAVPQVKENPYQAYYTALASPAPNEEIKQFVHKLTILLTMPGWVARNVTYSRGNLQAGVMSLGGTVAALADWSQANNVTYTIQPTGIFLTANTYLTNRPSPNAIYSLQAVLATFIDRLAAVYPGDHMNLGTIQKKPAYSSVKITISVDDISPDILILIGDQTRDLPMVIQNMKFSLNNGNLSGSIILDALGN